MRYTLAILPFLGLLLTIANQVKNSEYQFSAIVKGSLIWAFALVMSSNILSFFNLLFFEVLLAYWLVYTGFEAWRLYRNGLPKLQRPAFSKELAALSVIAAITLFVALAYPPTTYDSMTYHMPKVMHWWQNHTFEHYFTTIIRQNDLAPFLEIVVFHSYVLAESDWAANLPQWFAFIGCAFLAAGLAGQIGAKGCGKWFSALFAATIPMAIAQSGTTQTDMTVAFWLIAEASCFMIWQKKPSWKNTAFFGIALGLAILTKGTGYVISLPFVLAFAFISIKNYKLLFLKAALAGVLSIIIFVPHICRTYAMYGEFSPSSTANIVPRPTPATLIANIIANILSNDPALFGKELVEAKYISLVEYLGIAHDDPKIFPFGPITTRVKFSSAEDHAQNPVHLALALIIAAMVMFKCKNSSLKKYLAYFSVCVLLFCLLLTWQQWMARLQLPLFILAAPLCGAGLEELGILAKKLWRHFIFTLLCLAALYPLFFSHTRPIMPFRAKSLNNVETIWNYSREEFRFPTYISFLRDPYINSVNVIAKEKPASVGLYIGEGSWEYPLWILLHARLADMPRINHLRQEVPQFFTDTDKAENYPEIVFCLDRPLSWDKREGRNATLPTVYKRTANGYTELKE